MLWLNSVSYGLYKQLHLHEVIHNTTKLVVHSCHLLPLLLFPLSCQSIPGSPNPFFLCHCFRFVLILINVLIICKLTYLHSSPIFTHYFGWVLPTECMRLNKGLYEQNNMEAISSAMFNSLLVIIIIIHFSINKRYGSHIQIRSVLSFIGLYQCWISIEGQCVGSALNFNLDMNIIEF